MVLYDLYINGKLRDECRARNPIQALKLTLFAYADTNFVFNADKVEVKSSRRSHVYENVEYYCDDDSLYSNGERIA